MLVWMISWLRADHRSWESADSSRLCEEGGAYRCIYICLRMELIGVEEDVVDGR